MLRGTRLSVLPLLVFGPTLFAADYQIQANVRYDRYPQTVLDVMQPKAPALQDRPGILMIHGGGWVEGNKEAVVADWCTPFLDRGFVVVNVEYRLADVAVAPAALEDVLKAAQWFHRHAEEYKVDPKRIVVMGGSAGGNLALMTAMLPDENPIGPHVSLAGVIDFYGIADVADQLEGPHMQFYATTWVPEQSSRMEFAQRLSPINYVHRGIPPVLIIHGDADEVVPYAQSVRLAMELKAAHNDAELITIPGGKHGFTPVEAKMVDPILAWLKKRKIYSGPAK